MGRNTEVAVLGALVGGQTSARGAIVLGEPGVGKSRLIEHVCEEADAEGNNVAVARARPGTAAVSLGAFLDVLGAPPPPGDDASSLWWVRNTLLQRQGSESGLVLVVEDAHDADPLTLALCDHLVESGAAPVIITARSTEFAPDGLAALARREDVEVIRVSPLDAPATGRMAASIEGAPLESRTVAELYRLSGGLPLAVREIVRAAAEAGTPVSADGWTWSADLARAGGVEGVLFERLHGSDVAAGGLVDVLTAAGGSVPAAVASDIVGERSVRIALDRGLVENCDGWLVWTHALLGEIAAAGASEAALRSARSELSQRLGADSPDPMEVVLAAELDLLNESVDSALQLAAAEAALASGRPTDAITHAEAALDGDPASFGAALIYALATIRATPSAAIDAVGRAIDAADTIDEQLETIAMCGQLYHDVGLDPAPIFALVDEASAEFPEWAGPHLAVVRTLVSLDASPPAVTLDRCRHALAADEIDAVERAMVEGLASLMLAAVGEVEEAEACAASARDGPVEEMHPHNQAGGFYGGALAAIFGGRGDTAVDLVREGSDRCLKPGDAMSEIIHGSLQYTMAPFTGRAGTEMIELVPSADSEGTLRYGVVLRLHATWELALLGDPRGDKMWSEIQDAPARLRQGPGFIEAFVAVARAAAAADTAVAASLAKSLASEFAEARSAAAWLWFDCARHGEAEAAVPRLEEIADSQRSRYFPAIAADAAAAIAGRDPELLASAAAEFWSRGFPLFACELEVLSSLRYRAKGQDTAANRAVARARHWRTELPRTRTPILGRLEGHPLTDRQRVVSRLAASGLSNQEIADRLVVSKRTVENQLHRAYQALGVDRAGLRDQEL